MEWQNIARVAAPTLATALLGPLGGVAASIAAQALLGSDPVAAKAVTPAQIIEKIGAISDPDGMAKLKQAELDVQKYEADNNFRFADLEEKDRESARNMRSAALSAGSRTADQLGWVVMISFLLVAFVVVVGCGLIIKGIVTVNAGTEPLWLGISSLVGGIVGYFSANANQVVGFYFGSSASSSAKSDQLASNTETAINAIVKNQAKPAVTPPPGPAAHVAPGAAAALSTLQASPSSARFDTCVNWILDREGAYSDNSADHGGPTNFGITLATLGAWRHAPVTAEDVKNLTQDEAKAIYHANYWNAARCDALPAGVDLSVFDSGVMSGVGQGIKFMQVAAGLHGDEADGAVGKQTLSAVATIQPPALIEEIAAERDSFYDDIVARDASQQQFIQGWKNRVALTLARAKSMQKMWNIA